jgi:hypothetical protein
LRQVLDGRGGGRAAVRYFTPPEIDALMREAGFQTARPHAREHVVHPLR